SPERGRELIPDDIDLVGFDPVTEDEVETCDPRADPLDLLAEEVGLPLTRGRQYDTRDNDVVRDLDERPQRDFFEAPRIEVIAPDAQPLQLTGSETRRILHSPEDR